MGGAEKRKKMKLISWNVNGLRACMQKGFMEYFKEADADIFCLQETKMQPGQLELDLPGYYQYWNSAEPLQVTYGIGVEEHDHEGRVITAEFEDYFCVTVYVPNSQRELTRLDYRMEWEEAFLKYLKKLEETKPVIYCGDLNVAHQEIDLKNPKTNHNNAGFTDKERNCFGKVLENGFVDTFRYFYPDTKDAYSWWSYMGQARSRNVGWRIDYFVVSEALRGMLADAKIHSQVTGSDHCPVELDLK